MDDKIKVLKMIADDMKNDAKNFDGQPFTGKTVGEYFGNQGAAIAALANIMQSIFVGAINPASEGDAQDMEKEPFHEN